MFDWNKIQSSKELGYVEFPLFEIATEEPIQKSFYKLNGVERGDIMLSFEYRLESLSKTDVKLVSSRGSTIYSPTAASFRTMNSNAPKSPLALKLDSNIKFYLLLYRSLIRKQAGRLAIIIICR